MKKKLLFTEELTVWLRGRFALTGEEKIWMLLILIICWAGLVSRYFYIKHQPPPEAAAMNPEVASPDGIK